MNAIVLELKDVHYAYLGKFPALCGVNMTLKAGEKVAVIGANGTGKSTLLHLVDGLIFPDKGEVTAFGHRLSEDFFADDVRAMAFRNKVGLVFQNPDVQLFCPTVMDDIMFTPLQFGMAPEIVRKRLDALVRIFNIAPLLNRVPHQLSVGEKRKVALASVLINEPDVLLLDEPTAGLDPQTVRDIVDVLMHLQGAGKTILAATHDLHLVAEIADEVHVFGREKNIIRSGTPDEILGDSVFLRDHNLVHIHRHIHNGEGHVHPHGH